MKREEFIEAKNIVLHHWLGAFITASIYCNDLETMRLIFSNISIDNRHKKYVEKFANLLIYFSASDRYHEEFYELAYFLKTKFFTQESWTIFTAQTSPIILERAIEHDAVLNLQHIHDLGFDFRVQNTHNNTAMHIAVAKGTLRMMETLYPFIPESTNILTISGHSPLLLAAVFGQKEKCAFLAPYSSTKIKVEYNGTRCTYNQILKQGSPALQIDIKDTAKIPDKASSWSEGMVKFAKAALGNHDDDPALFVESLGLFQEFLSISNWTKELAQKELELAKNTTKVKTAEGEDKRPFIIAGIKIGREIQTINSEHEVEIRDEKYAIANLWYIFSMLETAPAGLFQFLEQELVARGEFDFLVLMYNNAYITSKAGGDIPKAAEYIRKAIEFIDSSDVIETTRNGFYLLLSDAAHDNPDDQVINLKWQQIFSVLAAKHLALEESGFNIETNPVVSSEDDSESSPNVDATLAGASDDITSALV